MWEKAEGQGMGRGAKHKGEVVQGIGHHGRKRSGKEGMCIGKKREVVARPDW